MRSFKVFSIIFLAAMLITVSLPTHSKADLAIKAGSGYLDKSSMASVIYTAPTISNTLQVRMACVSGDFRSERSNLKNLSLLELFGQAVDTPDNYTILQVVRVFNNDPDQASIWFYYMKK